MQPGCSSLTDRRSELPFSYEQASTCETHVKKPAIDSRDTDAVRFARSFVRNPDVGASTWPVTTATSQACVPFTA